MSDVIVCEGKKLAFASLALNALFTASKFSLYLLSGSSALLAETAHSLTDVIGSLLIVGGIYLSERKSDMFPWGLYKIENLVAIITAGMIFISVFEIGKMIYHPSAEGIRNLDMTIIILSLMAIPIIIFSRYEARRAKEINFPSLMADAEHWKMDIAPLAIVIAGILGTRFSCPNSDRISALLILVLILRAAYGILRDSIKSLLDASVDKSVIKKIEKILNEFPRVKTVSIQARNSGRFIFVYLDISLSLKKLKESSEITEQIEKKIKEQVPFVARVITQYEPEKKDFLRIAVPLVEKDGEISAHFASAPYIALFDIQQLNVLASPPEIIKNIFAAIDRGKGIRLAEFLVEKGIDILYIKEDFKGNGPEHVFSGAEVEVRKTNCKFLEELVKEVKYKK
ncbi:MAG: cation diffusion facilitator family transporter [Nitrospiraceae bacterium]|nr:cation diffusion facilitator family transporter [Nitrospiraceae bacterium]